MNKEIENELLFLEEKLLKPEVRKSAEEIKELLSDEFIEFGSSGKIYNKTDAITSIKIEEPNSIDINNFKASGIEKESVLVTYIAEKRNKDNKILNRSLRSSIWKKNNGKWQMLFHQGPIIK